MARIKQPTLSFTLPPSTHEMQTIDESGFEVSSLNSFPPPSNSSFTLTQQQLQMQMQMIQLQASQHTPYITWNQPLEFNNYYPTMQLPFVPQLPTVGVESESEFEFESDSITTKLRHSTQVMQLGVDWIGKMTHEFVKREEGGDTDNSNEGVISKQAEGIAYKSVLSSVQGSASATASSCAAMPSSSITTNPLKASISTSISSASASGNNSSYQTIQLQDKIQTDLPPILMDVEIVSSSVDATSFPRTVPASIDLTYYGNGNGRPSMSSSSTVAVVKSQPILSHSSLYDFAANGTQQPMFAQTVTSLAPTSASSTSSQPITAAKVHHQHSTPQSKSVKSESSFSIPHCLACTRPATMHLPSLPSSTPLLNLSTSPIRALSLNETTELCALMSDQARMDAQTDALLQQVKLFEEKQFHAYVSKHQQDAIAASENRKRKKKKRPIPPAPLFTESNHDKRQTQQKNSNNALVAATPTTPASNHVAATSTSSSCTAPGIPLSMNSGVLPPAKKKQKTLEVDSNKKKQKKKHSKQPTAPPSIEAIQRRATSASSGTSPATINLNKYHCLWIDPRTNQRCRIECSDYAARLEHIRIIHGAYPCRKAPCRFIGSTEAEYSSHVCKPLIPLNKQKMTKGVRMKSSHPLAVVPPVVHTKIPPILQPVVQSSVPPRPIIPSVTRGSNFLSDVPTLPRINQAAHPSALHSS